MSYLLAKIVFLLLLAAALGAWLTWWALAPTLRRRDRGIHLLATRLGGMAKGPR